MIPRVSFKWLYQAATGLHNSQVSVLPTKQWVPTQCQTIVMDLGNII